MASNSGPDFIVYVVRESGEGRNSKAFWSRVGAAWFHGKGEGLNVQLDATPLDGKLVLLPPRDDDDHDDRRGGRSRDDDEGDDDRGGRSRSRSSSSSRSRGGSSRSSSRGGSSRGR